MAKKPTVTTLQSGFNSTEVLNSNFEKLRDAFDNTLSLDGSTPNAMEADLDLNGNNIIGATGLLINGIDYVADVEAAKAAKDAALVAQSAASASATASANSATASASSAAASAASATAASASEAASAASETAAGASETAAATSETNAAASAATATTKAAEASASASSASTSASNAATSEANAATSATAAAASQTAAANSAASAAAAFDNFDDTYLGSKSSDPTVDNDGDPLTSGDLYFNSTANEMRVYDGANWIAASSAGGASLLNYNYTATAGQTTFSGADDNAATLSYTQQNLIVTLNGIVLEDGTDYTASNGTSIVLATGASAGDELNIVAFKSFTTADMVPASTGGTFSAPVTIDGNSTTVLTVDRATSDGTIIDVQKNGTSVGSIGSQSGKLQINGTSGTGFFLDTVQILPKVNGSLADNQVDLGSTGYRFNELWLGGGVYLGGTGAANKLDDYEVGTWTPVLTPVVGTIAVQGAFNTLNYTKVGRTVTVTGRFRLGSVTGAAGAIYINLPFTSAGVFEGAGFAALTLLTHGTDLPAGTITTFAEANPNSTVAYFYAQVDNAAWTPVDASGFADGDIVYVNGTYTAT